MTLKSHPMKIIRYQIEHFKSKIVTNGVTL